MTEKTQFLIVDYGASLIHTHNKQSIYGFADFLEKRGQKVEVWLPFGSKIAIPSFRFRRILLPGNNPTAFELKDISTWIPAIHGKLHDFSKQKNIYLIYKFLTFLSVIQFIAYSKKFRNQNKQFKVLFPTLCPFSMEIIKFTMKRKMRIEFYCRVTNTSEKRGPFTGKYRIENFINTLEIEERKLIKFGFETNKFIESLKIDNKSNLYSSKFPSRKIPFDSQRESKNVITFSFLGYPTPEKGHDKIFELIKSVEGKRSCRWIVQLYEKDEIEEKLRKLNVDIVFLKGKISQIRLEEAFFETDLLILPYNVEAFKFNASATLYQSMDFEVPVITFENSGFSDDVKKYSSGIVVKDLQQMVSEIISIDKINLHEFKIGCQKYNLARDLENSNFLNIDNY